jgi:adenylate cyclase
LAEAHASRGLAISMRKQWPEAEAEFNAAIRLNPKLFEAFYFYARAKLAEGKLDHAAQLFEQASHVNPQDFQSPAMLGMVYAGLERKAEAAAAYRRAYQIVEKHLELHPDDARALYLGAGALCQLGDRVRAEDWLNKAKVMEPDDPGVLYNVACCYSLLGKTEEAITCLEKAVDLGFAFRQWILNDSDLNTIRTHPRFTALLERLK